VFKAHVAAEDLVVLRIFDDVEDLLDGTINITVDTTDEDSIFARRVSCLSTNFDKEGFVFANNPELNRNVRVESIPI